MIFRKSRICDLENIMEIIKMAQKYLCAQNIDQWQNNYPNKEVIEKDIINNTSYVLISNDEIIGTLVLSFDGEKTYDKIYEGSFKNQSEYAVLHRVAISDETKGTGVAKFMLDHVYKICIERGITDIRIDTHENNQSMKKFLNKNGFEYRGIIYLEDGSKRIAFEKSI